MSQCGLGVTGIMMNGTGVTAPPGSIRAGFLENQTMRDRDAPGCSTKRITDGMTNGVPSTTDSSVNEVSENKYSIEN